ncbi:MAG: aminotransferase class V-fold PLP-dependent enzyme, partial [Actinomycetia bacterium]|nr:aminotransferase class V-fold PLP-dependent enzyme [Actinomycetes bacterium]
FEPAGAYFNTATCGLPPQQTVAAMGAVLEDWRRGHVNAPDFDPIITRARELYAGLVGVDPGTVAIGHQVSPFVGIIAESLPDDARVITATGDFTSVTFPFAAQQHRGVTIDEVPLESLAASIDSSVQLIAVSAVQSATGALADLEAICAAADAAGADVLLDVTQAAGWLPLNAGRIAYTVCSAYKWLLAPRGTAFLTVRADRLAAITPSQAGWYAGEHPWESIYGLPLRLAADARRFDVSPGWFSWVGTQTSLQFLTDIGIAELHRHALACERAFAEGAGLEPSGSAIRSLVADDEVPGLLAGVDASAAMRAGRLRMSFFANNTEQEALEIGALLRSHVRD